MPEPTPDQPQPQPAPVSLRSVFTNNLPNILEHFGISLVVSTYQAGRVILIRKDGEGINTHFQDFNKPMGIAGDGLRLTVGGQNTVWYFRNMPAVAPKLEPKGRHDACYLPRQIHVTGDIDIHELAWGGKDDLWIVNTRFGCLCNLDHDHSFTPKWRPHFITGLAPEDRCHLNGLAMLEGRPKYVTALGETDVAGGWRQNKRSGGVLMDVDTNTVLLRGLSMPHSPRIYGGRLWLLESGQGSIAWVDLPSRTWRTVAQVPGFTRGVDFAGPLAFIGLSQVRESAVFSGIPLVERLEERTCGVWVVNIQTGETVAFLRFEEGVQEIFAVQVVPARFPAMLQFGDEFINHSYVLPDEALKDVPAVLQAAVPAVAPPEGFEAEFQAGLAALEREDFAQAQAHLEEARKLAPDRSETYNNIGNVFFQQNRMEEAMREYRRALKLLANYPDAHMNLGMALMKVGDLPQGFREFEHRWQTKQFTPLQCPQPRWDGRPMLEQTLLVHTEQGAGDAIQFIRYLPMVKERAGRILLAAPEPLQDLFRTIAGWDDIIGAGSLHASAFDAYIPLLSLPSIFGTALDTIPAQIPYLAAPPDRAIDLAQLDARNPQPSTLHPRPASPLRVGVAWAGSPSQGNDHNRSARLADLTPLLAVEGVEWYSLQMGEKAGELEDGEPGTIRDMRPYIKDWADTAAIVSQLDLVISVDTGVVHLAGALGKPVWVLLCHAADYRWLMDRSDSPWYPTARLFRQQHAKDWAPVMVEAAVALRDLIST